MWRTPRPPITEHGEHRRKLPQPEFSPPEGVTWETDYVQTDRGVLLHSQSWLPDGEPKALVVLCHGYGNHCNWHLREIACRLAQSGYAVFGVDYEGHGKSDGLHGYVEDFDRIVQDVLTQCGKLRDAYDGKNLFVFGESMGGAVALLCTLKQADMFDGALLMAPMVKISEERHPHPIVTRMLLGLSEWLPRAQLVPSDDLLELCVQLPEVREWFRQDKLAYRGKPRLKTAAQLLLTSLALEKRLEEVSVPFMVLHGSEDQVTDPKLSEELFARACSEDKTMRLYQGQYHVLSHEPKGDEVLGDMIKWLDERV